MFSLENLYTLWYAAPVVLFILVVILALVFMQKNRLQYLRIVKLLSGWQSAILLLVVIPFILVQITEDAYSAILPWILYFIFFRLRARTGYASFSTENFDEEYEALSENNTEKINAFKNKQQNAHKITLVVITSALLIGLLWRALS